MHNNLKWTCPTCTKPIRTPFCATCGEQALRARDLSLRALIDQLVEAFTNIDGRLMRSFRYLVSKPGALTNAFLNGQRKPYLGPVALFLLCNVLFFATESLTGGKVFTTPLDSHLKTQPWSDAVQDMVANRLEAKQITLAHYAPVFDQAVASRARSLIIVMALVFALAPALMFLRTKRPVITHVVFSLHLYAFLLLLLCVATTIPAVSHWFGGVGLESEPMDYALSITLLIACAAYLYLATGVVYGERGVSRALKTAVLVVFVATVVLGYRFALLVVTLYGT